MHNIWEQLVKINFSAILHRKLLCDGFFFLIEPCLSCFKQLTRLRSGLYQAFRVLRDPGPSPVVRGERVPSSRAVSSSGGRGGPWLLYSARVFNIYGNNPFGASLPLSPVPLLGSVGLDIFGFHRDHRSCSSSFILGLGWNKTLALVAVWPTNLPWLSALKCFWGLSLF